jgi:hypothetical protein
MPEDTMAEELMDKTPDLEKQGPAAKIAEGDETGTSRDAETGEQLSRKERLGSKVGLTETQFWIVLLGFAAPVTHTTASN